MFQRLIILQFQFHTGSIKRYWMLITATSNINFNSILVQLKDMAAAKYCPGLSRFQFHTGSIKSWADEIAVVCPPNFNSILVQLKGRCCRRCLSLKAHFNSILVQLKDKEVHFYYGNRNLFQFHTGSIKRNLQRPGQKTLPYFNSILVLLKARGRSSFLSVADISIPYWFN